MNEDVMNQQIRRFLKRVGINSQREIEQAVEAAAATGALDEERVTATMQLSIPALGVELTIEDEIALE